MTSGTLRCDQTWSHMKSRVLLPLLGSHSVILRFVCQGRSPHHDSPDSLQLKINLGYPFGSYVSSSIMKASFSTQDFTLSVATIRHPWPLANRMQYPSSLFNPTTISLIQPSKRTILLVTVMTSHIFHPAVHICSARIRLTTFSSPPFTYKTSPLLRPSPLANVACLCLVYSQLG